MRDARFDRMQEAGRRTQDEMQTDLSEAVAEVQQVPKVCESQIEELEDDLVVARKEPESICLQLCMERQQLQQAIAMRAARVSENLSVSLQQCKR